MGSVKKAFKPITRVVDNIIPNEIKPALPYLAASFGAPYLAGKGILGALGTGAFGKGVSASLINAATNAALGRKFNPVSAAASGIMTGGGEFLKGFDSELAKSAGKFLSPGEIGGMTLGEAAVASSGPLAAGSMQAVYEETERANREYDEYVKRQQEAGAKDIQTRREYITRYMQMAGFEQDQISDALSRYGYETGGRVGFSNGGSLGDSMQSMKILLMKNEILAAGGGGFGGKDLDDKTDDEIIEIYEGMFGESKASGGRVGLAFGGMDPRGGKPTGDPILDSLIEESIDEETPPKGIMAAMDMFKKPNTGRVAQLFQQIEDGVNVSEAMAELLNVYNIDLYPKNAEGGRIGLKKGGTGDVLFDTYRDAFSELIGYPGYIIQDEMEFGSELLDDPKFFGPDSMLDMEDYRKERFGPDSPIAKYLKRLPEKKRKEALRLLRDKFANLGEYYKPEEEKYLEKRGYMADGGIMNLKVGGMPAEMDLRGGGFVPIGAKEKADDVPARLSKNEFVMTADAVRAAGGGSVNKGAKRMYDLMNKLEARV